MHTEIIWNQLSLDQWTEHFGRITRSTLLQSYPYARAMCKTYKQRARWGLIKINGTEAGLVQIIEAGLFCNLLHAVILDRGPLWFDGFGSAAHIQSFFMAFNQQFPPRLGRKRRIIPEIEAGASAQKLLQQCGLRPHPSQTPYQTLWWDTTLDDTTARNNLKTGWNGSLKKAEKANLDITWDINGLLYPWLRQQYINDKSKRGYHGVSPQILDNLAIFSTDNDPIIVGVATQNGEKIAGILLVQHGQSATYQIGWASQTGRKKCAHHLLLWQARHILNKRGVKALDLGGINDKTATGVTTFKQGTGATPANLVGQYS